VVGDSSEHVPRMNVTTPESVTTDPPPGPRVAPLAVVFSDVTFLHWRYEPDEVRPLLLPGTSPDSFDEAAYVGLVAFRMRCHGEFLEFNVRTYSLDEQGRRGVVFLTMEANRLPWVLAARSRGPAVPVVPDEPCPRRSRTGLRERAALAGPDRPGYPDSRPGREADQGRYT
jgi:hypothetical protein